MPRLRARVTSWAVDACSVNPVISKFERCTRSKRRVRSGDGLFVVGDASAVRRADFAQDRAGFCHHIGDRKEPPISTSSPRETMTSPPSARVFRANSTAAAFLFTTMVEIWGFPGLHFYFFGQHFFVQQALKESAYVYIALATRAGRPDQTPDWNKWRRFRGCARSRLRSAERGLGWYAESLRWR